MKCSKCGSKFIQPLYLFNGMSTCPICKSELLAINNLIITKENEELFRLSSIAFMRYLSPTSCKIGGVGAHNLTKENLLETAYNYCQKSAGLGNPNAIYQMAYFAEYFQMENKNQIERIRQAFEYYGALCYSDLSYVKVEDGVKEFSEQAFRELKINSAKNLLRIAYVYSDLLKTSLRYDYKKNKDRLSDLYKTAILDAVSTDTATFDKISAVLNVLVSTRSKTKAPLFGVFMLTGRQLKELFDKKGENGQSIVLKLIVKDPDFLRYMLCDKNGNAKGGDRYFNRLASSEAVDGLMSQVEEDDNLFLYFFNAYGKHNYLSGKQIGLVKKDLEADDQALLFSFASLISEDVAVFYDDDIEQFKTGKSVSGAVSALAESIRGEK